MSRSIRISEKLAWVALRLLQERSDPASASVARTIEKLLQPKRHVLAAKKLKAKKTRAHSKSTKEIRAEVMERAEGGCEVVGCGATVGVQLDHFWGRAKAPQSTLNCWLLCYRHHREKTDSVPDRELWLQRFAVHAGTHGYVTQKSRALNQLDAIALQAEAESLGGAR